MSTTDNRLQPKVSIIFSWMCT